MAEEHIIQGPAGRVVIIDGVCHKRLDVTLSPPDAVGDQAFETCDDCGKCTEESACADHSPVFWATIYVPSGADANLLAEEVLHWASYRKDDNLFPGKEYSGRTCPEGQIAVLCSANDVNPAVTPGTEEAADCPCPDCYIAEFPAPCRPICIKLTGSDVVGVDGEYTLITSDCQWTNGTFTIIKYPSPALAPTPTDQWVIVDATDKVLYDSVDGVNWNEIDSGGSFPPTSEDCVPPVSDTLTLVLRKISGGLDGQPCEYYTDELPAEIGGGSVTLRKYQNYWEIVFPGPKIYSGTAVGGGSSGDLFPSPGLQWIDAATGESLNVTLTPSLCGSSAEGSEESSLTALIREICYFCVGSSSSGSSGSSSQFSSSRESSEESTVPSAASDILCDFICAENACYTVEETLGDREICNSGEYEYNPSNQKWEKDAGLATIEWTGFEWKWCVTDPVFTFCTVCWTNSAPEGLCPPETGWVNVTGLPEDSDCVNAPVGTGGGSGPYDDITIATPTLKPGRCPTSSVAADSSEVGSSGVEGSSLESEAGSAGSAGSAQPSSVKYVRCPT